MREVEPRVGLPMEAGYSGMYSEWHAALIPALGVRGRQNSEFWALVKHLVSKKKKKKKKERKKK